jgi:hypothetical protein
LLLVDVPLPDAVLIYCFMVTFGAVALPARCSAIDHGG